MRGGMAALLCAAALGCASVAIGQDRVPVNTRDEVIAPDARITDDPRRIPLRAVEPAGEVTILAGGLVFDAVAATFAPGDVVLQDDRVRAVLPAGSADRPAGARIIDVAGRTVLPGLIDLHVHVTYPDRATPYDLQASEGDGVLRGARNLHWMLESGITTVRDLNGVANAPYLLADASAAGTIPAPRVITAGHIITGTGGHATERPVTPSHGPDFAWERDGADAWRAAVRATFKAGAGVIKVASHFARDEIAAAIEEAHRLGLRVTCDCETIYTDMAVAAGIDMVEHPLPRGPEAIAAMARNGTAAVPTLQVYQNLLDTAGGFWGSTSRRFTMTSQANFAIFRQMQAAGIVMGVGTDTIGNANLQYPNNFIAELKWFVKGGYSIAGALQAATLTNARLLDMEDRIGSLEPGKQADIVVIDGRPDQDLDALGNVDMVFRSGRLVVAAGQLVTPRHVPLPLARPSPPEGAQ
jgi:imidazolonepropionase-like amidohydrolase